MNNRAKNNATQKGVIVIGIIGGFVSIEHGFFEILQGNMPTNGIRIEAIGRAWRFDGGVGEMAITLIPNFLITGIAAVLIGIALIIWSVLFSGKKFGALGFFCLSILTLLFGGGVAYFIIALINSIVATRINKPLHWWKKYIPEKLKTILAVNWKITLTFFAVIFLVNLAIAIFGLAYIGIGDVNQIAINLGFLSLVLYVISIFACFSFDVQKKNN